MEESRFVESVLVMLVLLNPFLMSVHLVDVMAGLSTRVFGSVLLRAVLISATVFSLFAAVGESFFTGVLNVRYEAFLIFGGLILFTLGIRFLVLGAPVIAGLRGPPEHLAGALAMPMMIGPGTISASIVVGHRSPVPWAILAILTALAVSGVVLIFLKVLHDMIKRRNANLVDRYMEIAGRASALILGTIAVNMVLTGIEGWLSGL